MLRNAEECLYIFLFICCPSMAVLTIGLLTHPMVGIGIVAGLMFTALRYKWIV